MTLTLDGLEALLADLQSRGVAVVRVGARQVVLDLPAHLSLAPPADPDGLGDPAAVCQDPAAEVGAGSLAPPMVRPGPRPQPVPRRRPTRDLLHPPAPRCIKTAFSDEMLAWAEVERSRRAGNPSGPTLQSVYWCAHCDGWHTTSRPTPAFNRPIPKGDPDGCEVASSHRSRPDAIAALEDLQRNPRFGEPPRSVYLHEACGYWHLSRRDWDYHTATVGQA